MIQDFIPVNKYSRPGLIRSETLGVVVHWVANPGSTPKQNRDYFAGLADTGIEVRFASTQYIIGIDGEILQTMPEDEIAYHCGARDYREEAISAFGKYCTLPLSPNHCTVGIEFCHEDWSGEFTNATLQAAVGLCADICYRYLIPAAYIFRHYDITEKNCPKWFVEHSDDFYRFRVEVIREARGIAEKQERKRGWIV